MHVFFQFRSGRESLESSLVPVKGFEYFLKVEGVS